MNFKIPVIIGSIIFLFIFLINLIIRNSFIVVMVRSLISAIIGFGISFGVIFLFKNVLNIEWSNDLYNSNDELLSDTDQKVDITAGEDDNYNEPISYDYSPNSPENSNGNLSTDDFSTVKENSVMPISTDEDDMDIEELEFVDDDDSSELPQMDAVGESSILDGGDDQNINGESSKNAGVSSDEFVDLMRDKIGQDATSKDTAKAIRTIMNKE